MTNEQPASSRVFSGREMQGERAGACVVFEGIEMSESVLGGLMRSPLKHMVSRCSRVSFASIAGTMLRPNPMDCLISARTRCSRNACTLRLVPGIASYGDVLLPIVREAFSAACAGIAVTHP